MIVWQSSSLQGGTITATLHILQLPVSAVITRTVAPLPCPAQSLSGGSAAEGDAARRGAAPGPAQPRPPQLRWVISPSSSQQPALQCTSGHQLAVRLQFSGGHTTTDAIYTLGKALGIEFDEQHEKFNRKDGKSYFTTQTIDCDCAKLFSVGN